MHVHHRPDLGEVVHPLRIGDGEIDTAVAHGRSEIVMPVRAVDSIISIEIHDVWNIREIIPRPRHGSGTQFDSDLVADCYGWRLPCARGNNK